MEWQELEMSDRQEIAHGDIRLINATIPVLFIWSDNIVDEVDEFNKPVSFKSGWVFEPIKYKGIYNGDPTTLLYHTTSEHNGLQESK